MATVTRAPKSLRAARAYPVPKRKPARLSVAVARSHAHSVRKPKSR